jgi:hypothetical protein
MDRQSAHGGECWVSPRHRRDKSAARKIDVISSAEMFDVAACGAKVLQARCAEYARRFSVLLHVRSSFIHADGTLVIPDDRPATAQPAAFTECPVISSVANKNSTAWIRVEWVPDVPGKAAQVFATLSAVGSSTDTVCWASGCGPSSSGGRCSSYAGAVPFTTFRALRLTCRTVPDWMPTRS